MSAIIFSGTKMFIAVSVMFLQTVLTQQKTLLTQRETPLARGKMLHQREFDRFRPLSVIIIDISVSIAKTPSEPSRCKGAVNNGGYEKR